MGGSRVARLPTTAMLFHVLRVFELSRGAVAERRGSGPWHGLARVLARGVGWCLAGCLLLDASQLAAQPTWEYSPYRIVVWFAAEEGPELSASLRSQIRETVQDRALVDAGAAWDLRVRECPPALRQEVLRRMDQLTVEDIDRTESARLRVDDKLIVLGVHAEAAGYRIQARELDSRTRTWQPQVTHRVLQPHRVAETAFQAVLDAFAPLVRIEQVRGRDVQVRVRAAGLILDSQNPAHIPANAILRPVIRRNDRTGEPVDGGVMFIPWTFLVVQQQDGHLLECLAHSGVYSLLAVRASVRLQKYALWIQPPGEESTVQIVRRGDGTPLPGYAIYRQNPQTEETTRLGQTDWRGKLVVPREDLLLQVLYVRNGGRLLARLPIIPGLEEELTAEVRDDNRRLEAEGYVRGIQNLVMDLVARRELYISRFRRHLRAEEFDQARALLEEFDALPNRSDLARELVQQGQRFSSSELSDRREQAQIDQLFKETQELLSRFLDPGTGRELAAELAAARRAG